MKKTAKIEFHYTKDQGFAWLTHRGKILRSIQFSGWPIPRGAVAKAWLEAGDETPGQSAREDAYKLLRREALAMGFDSVKGTI